MNTTVTLLALLYLLSWVCTRAHRSLMGRRPPVWLLTLVISVASSPLAFLAYQVTGPTFDFSHAGPGLVLAQTGFWPWAWTLTSTGLLSPLLLHGYYGFARGLLHGKTAVGVAALSLAAYAVWAMLGFRLTGYVILDAQTLRLADPVRAVFAQVEPQTPEWLLALLYGAGFALGRTLPSPVKAALRKSAENVGAEMMGLGR